MRRAAALSVYVLAAACWLAGGPGGSTVEALLACRHHRMHQTHDGHASTPPGGPCFCGEMTSGSDVAVSPAVPAPLGTQLVVTLAARAVAHPSPFPFPDSPSFPPESPPPNGSA